MVCCRGEPRVKAMDQSKLKFDMTVLLQPAHRTITNHLGDVTLALPLGSPTANQIAKEMKVARARRHAVWAAWAR